MPTRPPQHLIFDADDTLWENNVAFEGVIADFIARLDHPRLTAPEVRDVMDGIEREHAARYGFGTKVFEVTLEETVRRLHDGILPAVAAGLRAVFIAHPHTCRLEVVALPENDARILRVTRFRELATLF